MGDIDEKALKHAVRSQNHNVIECHIGHGVKTFQ